MNHLRPIREPRPKTVARLKQGNKSNRLMRRFYTGSPSRRFGTTVDVAQIHGR